ncbi:Hypothetical predicted protein [Cloeon dipterum]|uniref:HTH psq-type domain-containing protein n=1 Tax=Cloeon dipterum TaxID=197152 RepID=A0A8S1CHP6_9INSE|nr:Hypothetical predicted protein [Cloeon dipterum]
MAGPISSSEEEIANNPNKRIRRSEEELSEAANLISRGLTFQAVSDKYNIPISTIRFYMARKGILPRRKRGRVNSHPVIEGIAGSLKLLQLGKIQHTIFVLIL